MKQLAVLPIRFYRRFVSPYKPPTCRFHPTCSASAEQAIRSHGVMRGTLLATFRILRCNPWGGFGDDPVPPPRGRYVSRRGDIPEPPCPSGRASSDTA